MAKKSRSLKHTQIRSQQGLGGQLEQTEIIDDNLLPDAVEIERLVRIDPDIMTWLKVRAEQEQGFRHDLVRNRDKIVKSEFISNRWLNFAGLFVGFIVIMSALYLSYLLISQDHVIQGSIFGGTALVMTIGIFVTRHLAQNKDNTN